MWLLLYTGVQHKSKNMNAAQSLLWQQRWSPCPLDRQNPQNRTSGSQGGGGFRPWPLKTESQMGYPKCISGKEKYQQQSHHHKKNSNQPKPVIAYVTANSRSSVFLLSAILLLICFSCCVTVLSGFWCFVDHHRARDLERVFSAACVRWVAAGTTEVRGSKMRGPGKDFVSRSMLQDKKNSIYSQMPLIITLWPVSVFTFRVLLFLACSSALWAPDLAELIWPWKCWVRRCRKDQEWLSATCVIQCGGSFGQGQR